MAEIALNALNPLPNMIQKRIEAVLVTLAPILTDNAPIGEARMAEKACRIYHISRQGQPRSEGAV